MLCHFANSPSIVSWKQIFPLPYFFNCFSRNLSSGLSSVSLKHLFPKDIAWSRTSLGQEHSCNCVEVFGGVLDTYLQHLIANHKGSNKVFNSSCTCLQFLPWVICSVFGEVTKLQGILTVFVFCGGCLFWAMLHLALH